MMKRNSLTFIRRSRATVTPQLLLLTTMTTSTGAIEVSRSPFDGLGHDLTLNIFSFFRKRSNQVNLIDAKTVYSTLQVCKQWRNLFDSYEFWKGHCALELTAKCMVTVVDYDSRLGCLLGCRNLGKDKLIHQQNTSLRHYKLKLKHIMEEPILIEIHIFAKNLKKNSTSWVHKFKPDLLKDLYFFDYLASYTAAVDNTKLHRCKNTQLPVFAVQLDFSYTSKNSSTKSIIQGRLYRLDNRLEQQTQQKPYKTLFQSVSNQSREFRDRLKIVPENLKVVVDSKYYMTFEEQPFGERGIYIGARNWAKVCSYISQACETFSIGMSYTKDLATLYFAQLISRSKFTFKASDIQLLVSACIYVAAGIAGEETVEFDDLLYSMDSVYDRSAFEAIIADTLQCLQFRFAQVTMSDYILLWNASVDEVTLTIMYIEMVHCLAGYIEPTREFRTSLLTSTIIALALAWAAMDVSDGSVISVIWPTSLEQATGYSLESMKSCMFFLCEKIETLLTTNIDCTPSLHHLVSTVMPTFPAIKTQSQFDEVMRMHMRHRAEVESSSGFT